MRFGKKGKLAPRYIGPFEIGENWHGCISVGFASEYVPSASSVPYLDAEEVYFRPFTRVAAPECGIE